MVPLLFLLACSSEPSQGRWLQGAGFEWKLFNHRVSHLEWRGAEDPPRSAIVGGTSTTGQSASLPESCDPNLCEELPFRDESTSFLRWVQVESDEALFVAAQAELVVDADGEETAITIELPRKARGRAEAVLAGLRLSTDQPLAGGAACYDPAFGWHPRRIQVELGSASLGADGRSASLTVQGAFEAGNSLEEMRQCIDEVAQQARVALQLDLVLILGEADLFSTHELDQAMSYSYGAGPSNPDPQPDPDPAERAIDVDVDRQVVGWQALDWRFHVDDPEGRGAYIRKLLFDAAEGQALGHATNYSPITQISGFDYHFQGRLLALDLPEAERQGERAEALIPAELDGAGEPVLFELSSP